MSATKRNLTEIKSKTPGSGKYEYKTFIGEGPKYSMRPKYTIDGITEGRRSVKAYKKSEVPGPGHYDPLDNTHGPRYTIGLKREGKKGRRGSVPGVGTYNIAKDEDFKVPSYIISKEKRKNLNVNHTALNYPGPNKYDYDLSGASSKAPKWTFSKSERFGKSGKIKPKSAMVRSSSMPGPGSYKTQYFIGHDGPIYSFPKEKLSHADAIDVAMEKKTMHYPSPTTYNLNIRYIPNTPIITMAKSKRKDLDNDKYSLNFPGPGHYHPNKYDFKLFEYATAMHQAIREKDDQYNQNHTVSGKCRVVAGYTYEWISQKQFRDGEDFDIILDSGDYRAKWNLRCKQVGDRYSWLNDPESVNEVGCIHTCQGLDMNYCGVIIGMDLQYRDGKLLFCQERIAKSDRNSGIRKADKKTAERLIRNTYHVLLTRGMLGTFVYCEDKGLREYLRGMLTI